MRPCLLWMVAVALVVEAGQSVDPKRPPPPPPPFPRRATEAGGEGGQLVAAGKDSVAKRNIPTQTPTQKTPTSQPLDQQVRLSRKMLRICYLEKKLRKAFGRRLTNVTSNLLRFYDLPAGGATKLDPLLREAYLVHRCPHDRSTATVAASTPADLKLPNKNKTKTAVVDGRVRVADGQTASASGQTPHQKLRHHKETCTGIRVYVSFSDLGWADWIVQPKGFVTTVCIGTCQRDRRNTYPLLTPKSKCCSPSHYKSLQVLHYSSSGSLNVTVLPDLVAVRCRCRRC